MIHFWNTYNVFENTILENAILEVTKHKSLLAKTDCIPGFLYHTLPEHVEALKVRMTLLHLKINNSTNA